MSVKILVIHGPNLNLLGKREPEIYGYTTLADINKDLSMCATKAALDLYFMQSNHEGAIVDAIQSAMDGKYSYIILNAGAYTHYSIAIRDAIAALKDVYVIEVHLSNIHKREEFRHKSVLAPVVWGQIVGFGAYSYILALQAIIRREKEAMENES